MRAFGTANLCLVAALAAARCALPGAAGAQAQASACRLEAVGTGTVRAVPDGRTLRLDDGREVRLAGIAVPPLAAPPSRRAAELPAPPASADFGAAAQAALAAFTLGKPVILKSAGPQRDRYDRIVAQAFVTAEGLERSIQHYMIGIGLAWVGPRADDPACAVELLVREREARSAARGLWADPGAVRRADDPAAIRSDRGRFALVEGRVLSVRESGGTIYVNFGRRWAEDFTVTIAKRNERMFTAAGLEPKRLARQRIRVRGYVEERGGPWIDASRPEQIELLARD